MLLRKRNAAIRLNLSFCAREERKCCGVRVRGENKTFTVTLSVPETKILANELVLGLARLLSKNGANSAEGKQREATLVSNRARESAIKLHT